MRQSRLALLVLLVAATAAAGVREVELALTIRSKLALSGNEKIYLGPFLRESSADEAAPDLKFDVAAEFERYLRRLLRREGKFALAPTQEGLRVPTNDPLALAKDSEFWRALGAQTGVDFIVAGSIDFRVENTTMPTTERYESPVDGRTYYRQRLVEQTGFSYDIMLSVFDARTGALLFQEPLKDTKQVQESKFDEFTGMFTNLYSLENQLIGIFVPRTVKSKRVLMTP
jgi:hypothetical protein